MHSDEINLSKLVGSTIQRAGQTGFLTNAGVAAANTKQGLKNFVNSVVVHADQEGFRRRIAVSLDADAGITDAAVLNLTTVAGLAALTQVSGPSNLDLYGD